MDAQKEKTKGTQEPMSEKEQNSACDRPLRKGIKRLAQKGVQQD